MCTSSIAAAAASACAADAAAQLRREQRQHRPHALRRREQRVGHRALDRLPSAGHDETLQHLVDAALVAGKESRDGLIRAAARGSAARRFGLGEHQHVLVAQDVRPRDQTQTGLVRLANHALGIDALVHRRPGPAARHGELDDAEPAVGLERASRRCGAAPPAAPSRDTRRRSGWHRACPTGSFGSSAVPSTVSTLSQVLARQPPLDDLDHLRLDVFGVDPAVRADAPRQPDREPAAGGAEISDDAAFGDVEGVHDLIGPLPDVAIRALELSRGSPAGTACRAAAAAGCRGAAASAAAASRDAARPVRFVSRRLCFLRVVPARPGEVIASGDEDRIERVVRHQPALADDLADRAAGLDRQLRDVRRLQRSRCTG